MKSCFGPVPAQQVRMNRTGPGTLPTMIRMSPKENGERTNAGLSGVPLLTDFDIGKHVTVLFSFKFCRL